MGFMENRNHGTVEITNTEYGKIRKIKEFY